jgi:tRNA(Ile)-lysidine synthase
MVSLPAKQCRRGFDPAQLARHLGQDFPVPEAYWVAFSGGVDSTVLLQALAAQRTQLPAPLRAVHIDHGLHDDSAQWATHCDAVCRALDIALTVRAVEARHERGESPEAAARAARYTAIAAVVPGGGMLLTAHHRDDQAETLLLQLLRGAGVAGLAAMPVVRRFGSGWHGRPLLAVSRAAMHAWAVQQGLRWIDDPSNASVDQDRNFLRHAILPKLHRRWPSAAHSLSRSASHCAGVLEALHEQAADDLQRVRRAARRIDLAALAQLSTFRQRAVLLRWFSAFALPTPGSAELAEVLAQLFAARPDASLCFDLGDHQLRRYAGDAWLIPAVSARPPGATLSWPAGQDVIALAYGTLTRRLGVGGIDPQHWSHGDVRIGFRTPGLRCQPIGRVGHRGFKALVQEHGIPPWQRPFLPILLIHGQPAAIANCCVCEPFGAGPSKHGWLIEWSAETPDDVC